MEKYKLNNEQLANNKELNKKQEEYLLNKINNKLLDKIIFNKQDCKFRDDKSSSFD